MKLPPLWVAVWLLGVVGYPAAISLVLLAMMVVFTFTAGLVITVVMIGALIVAICVYPMIIGVVIILAARRYGGPSVWKIFSFVAAGALIVAGAYPLATANIKINGQTGKPTIHQPGWWHPLGSRV
jgi:hypothetical protein